MKVNESNRPEFIAIVITIIFWIFFVFLGISKSNPNKSLYEVFFGRKMTSSIGLKRQTSSNSGCNISGSKSFAVDRLNSTIGTTQFLDLHKDNGDSWLFYGSVYSSQHSRDVTVFILIGCSGGSYSVLNVDVQL